VEEFSAPSSIAQEGQVWYNTTSTVLKGFGQQGTGAWASGVALSTGVAGAAGQGTVTAALVEGGGTNGTTGNTQSFNGSAWTELGNLVQARSEFAGAGTQTAAIIFGGVPTSYALLCETWDGTSWTEGNNITSGRDRTGGYGITTATMCVAGQNPSGTAVDNSETYDGTCWSEGNDLNTARKGPTAFGTTTASLCASGDATACESYDGTSWTEVNNQNTSRTDTNQGGFGIQTAGMVFGGSPVGPVGDYTETWNGTSWTEVANLAADVRIESGAGTANLSALSMGGAPGSRTTVEEWSVPDAIKTFTAS
jgi:hypothetical protein